MLGKFFKNIGAGTAKKEQEDFLNLVREGTDNEMAQTLAAVGMVRQLLWGGKIIDGRFPEELFSGSMPITDKARGELAMYLLKLNSLRNELSQSSDSNHQFFASGISVYIVTFRALTRPELFVLGRQIWRELLRGSAGYESEMKARRPDLTLENFMAVYPAPNAIVPPDLLAEWGL